MTKKHFRLLAKNFSIELGPRKLTVNERLLWERLRDIVADVCQETNPRFDRSKFIAACENGL